METFALTCRRCGDRIEFEIADVEGLDEQIAREKGEAVDEAVENAAADARDDLHAIVGGRGRRLFDLSAAIRRGDRQEAELLLDRISDELGVDAREQVQQGRYSLLAKIA